MATSTERFSPELGGSRDLAYVPAQGRRLTEYEAVSCYTQPGVEGGGMQEPGHYLLRENGRPIFDLDSTKLKLDNWYLFRDPNQLWQRGYYQTQARAERSIEAATQTALASGLMAEVDPQWVNYGLARVYLPFAHLEYGLFRTFNPAAREALSDTLGNVLVFNAGDKLRHAQAISLLGLDLEGCFEGFSCTSGRAGWLDDDVWQPVRQLVEGVMAIIDWCEAILAVNAVVEPLLGEPLRRLVFTSHAARHGDILTPHVAGTAIDDWRRNSVWTQGFQRFVAESPGGDGNQVIVDGWVSQWTDTLRPVADGFFAQLEKELGASSLAASARRIGEAEQARVVV